MTVMRLNRRQIVAFGGGSLALTAVGGASAKADAVPVAPLRQDIPGPLRLLANENPYGPSPKARDAMLAAFDEAHRYAMRPLGELKTLIAEKEDVAPESVVIGAGSGEILRMAGLVFGRDGGEILTGDPTFEMLQPYAEKAGANVARVPLTQDAEFDLAAIVGQLSDKTRLVYVCNPNNPTGTMVDAGELKNFCANVGAQVPVFIDEAYMELAVDADNGSMVDLVRKGENVIVSRTFSKLHGMAGMRIGYGLMKPELVERLKPYRMSSPNMLGLRAAIASLQDAEFQDFSKSKIFQGRKMVYDVLNEIGASYRPSNGNFVFFKPPIEASDFSARLRAEQVLIRADAPWNGHCRVSIGTVEQMSQFQERVRKVMQA